MVYDNDNPQYAQDLLDILSGFNATENKELRTISYTLQEMLQKNL